MAIVCDAFSLAEEAHVVVNVHVKIGDKTPRICFFRAVAMTASLVTCVLSTLAELLGGGKRGSYIDSYTIQNYLKGLQYPPLVGE